MQTPSAIQPSLLATTWIRFKQAPPQDHGLSMVDDDWSAVLGSFSHAKGVQLCVILGRFEILHKGNDDQLMMIKNKRPVNPTPFSGFPITYPTLGISENHRLIVFKKYLWEHDLLVSKSPVSRQGSTVTRKLPEVTGGSAQRKSEKGMKRSLITRNLVALHDLQAIHGNTTLSKHSCESLISIVCQSKLIIL